MEYVYLCGEHEEYSHTTTELITNSKQKALDWLGRRDVGEDGKPTMYGNKVIATVTHCSENDDDPCWAAWDWDELWYKYNGYGTWYRVEKRKVQ